MERSTAFGGGLSREGALFKAVLDGAYPEIDGLFTFDATGIERFADFAGGNEALEHGAEGSPEVAVLVHREKQLIEPSGDLAGGEAARPGGAQGGTIVASGTPEQVARNTHSYTGKYLARTLKNNNGRGDARGSSKSTSVANG